MRILLTAVLLAGVAVPAHAATIVGLYNTGVDNTGAKLAANNAVDTHYTVTTSTGTASPVTYTNSAYLTDPSARFISAQSGGGYTVNPSNYTLTFNLTGFKAETASISGNFAADNYASVYLNDILLAAQPAQTIYENFQQLTSFSANSGFVAGVNTLRFEVTDTGPPSALLVTGLVGSVAAVPEPATWALFILGFGGIGGAMRRRSSAVRVTKASLSFS